MDVFSFFCFLINIHDHQGAGLQVSVGSVRSTKQMEKTVNIHSFFVELFCIILRVKERDIPSCNTKVQTVFNHRSIVSTGM